jgi:serine/threonine kinase 17
VVRRCHRKSGAASSSGSSQCAAKMLRRRRVGKDCRADIMHEVGVLEAVRGHPRFVQLVEVFESSRDIVIVTEL